MLDGCRPGEEVMERAGNPDEGTVQVLSHDTDMAQGRAPGTEHSRYRQKLLFAV